jgi:hypothetical protein
MWMYEFFKIVAKGGGETKAALAICGKMSKDLPGCIHISNALRFH